MTAHPSRAGVPRSVWALGFVSLFMDLSSELVHAVLPLFLVATLGASPLVFGIIEGVAEAAVMVTKFVAGALSDYWGRRKPLALAGYGLAALTKPLFPLAESVATVFAARLLDRVGKGVRGAPRDALVADLTPPGARGAAYGLRQALDSAGAVGGPLLAVGLMVLLADDARAVMWFAVVPGAISVAILVLGVREPARASRTTAPWSLRPGVVRGLGRDFWEVVGVGAVLTLARFSEGFLVLRAVDLGVALAYAPLVLVGMNVVYALGAYPFGELSDRVGRQRMLVLGALALAAGDLVLATTRGPLGLGLGAALWGVHLGLCQGLLAALVADAAPAALRATAFGVFNLVTGVALFAASAIAGVLWAWTGPAGTFALGAALAGLAALLVRARALA